MVRGATVEVEKATRTKRLRERFVDGPESLGAHKRAARWELFGRLFPNIEQMRIIDLGGTTEAWLRAPYRPAHVVVMNLFEPGDQCEDWLIPHTGDACAARASLETAGLSTDYDLVFSNSLLEHVGGHANRLAVAQEVHALAPRHWVQTPYRYFPIEPHWLFPGMQLLPIAARGQIAAHWPLAHTMPDSSESAFSGVQWTELVGIAEMRTYFPGSVIHRERMAGLVKSLIAISTG